IEGAMTVETRLVPKTYKVSYSVPEDENLHETSIDVEYHGEYALATPVRYGYSFVAWKTPEGALLAQEGDEWSIVGDVVLTAEWQNNYYEITFVHADNTTTVVIVENGDTLAAERVPTCKPIPGYTVRWEDKDFSTITSGTTVQAVKEAKSYQVTYQLKAGESISGENPLTVEYGKSYQLPIPNSTDTRLYFSCWKNAATGEKVAMSGTWKIASDVVLVADWVRDSDWTDNH
ncbi:MAG: InlB B-repeat-containing protein, partial [Clostridia bacterium]|nr:InlB B-repeat-containing protein [Clostridia bacterium]